MYKVMSGVRKRALTVWVGVCFLLGTYVCLPLEHTCLDLAGAGLRAKGHQTSTGDWSGPGFSGHAAAVEAKAGEASSHRHDTCLACVWAHSLLDDQSAAAAGIPDGTEAACFVPPGIRAVGSNHFQAPFKRGPPASMA